MSKNESPENIHERIYRWVIAVLKFLDQVPKSAKTINIISQLSRSVTSVGANDREANSASTVKDFCHKYSIVKKETAESMYWIRVIGDLFFSLKSKTQVLEREGEEILNIVATIIRNTKKTNAKRIGGNEYAH